jgi:hypothetical protein
LTNTFWDFNWALNRRRPLVLVGRRSDRQLSTEFLRGRPLEPLRRLRVDPVWTGEKTEPISKLVLRQLLHTHDYPAAGAFAAKPGVDEMVNLPPAAEIEIADTKVRTFRNFEGIGKCRKERQRDVVKDSGHSQFPSGRESV